MKFKIHRGTNEIGGSCVEVWTENTKIFIDFGMPLVDDEKKEFDFKKYQSLSINELIAEGVLPDIEGLYDKCESNVDGILISHPHQDHYGLINYIDKDVPFFLGVATHRLIELNNTFTGQNIHLTKCNYFEKSKTFHIGDFAITAYWADHSAFDSYSFLIKAGDKSIFYSGDFRSHGRKAKAFNWFIDNAPKNVDYLLLEGTSLSRQLHKFKSEEIIESEFIELFKQKNKINLIYCSGQNIDRIVSLYRACLQTGKTLVVDVYIATVLKELQEFAKIPYPSEDYPHIKVIFPHFLCKRLEKENNEDVFQQFDDYRLDPKDINRNSNNIVMTVRPSMKFDISKMYDIDGGNIIYSMWSGYLKKKKTMEFIDYLKNRNFELYQIHTSGHGDVFALNKMVDALSPKYIVPIHTFEKNKYKDLFNISIIELEDKEIREV